QCRIAGHQRRRSKADDLPEREIPGHHGENDTERLERNEAPRTLDAHVLAGEKGMRVLGEEVAAERATCDFRDSITPWLSHFLGAQARIASRTLAQQPRALAHGYGAPGDTLPAPALERPMRVPDDALDLLLGCLHILGDHCTGRGIDGPERHAGCS